MSIHGCPLQLSAGGTLTGMLQDGTAIDTPTQGLTAANLISTCPSPSGVLPPVNADGTSIFKRGSTVPVKFALTGASAGITTLAANLYIAKISNNVAGTEAEAVSSSPASTGSLCRYDATCGRCIYNWGTQGLTTGAGMYQLRIDLGGGAEHTVPVRLE